MIGTGSEFHLSNDPAVLRARVHDYHDDAKVFHDPDVSCDIRPRAFGDFMDWRRNGLSRSGHRSVV